MNLFAHQTTARGRCRVSVIALAICLLVSMFGQARIAVAELDAGVKTSYSAIYSSENPIPEIAKVVRPAVVQVITIMQTWSVEDGAKDTDMGYGSGVLIDARGHIVTNYHVIQDADIVEVEILNGKRIPCEIIGFDDGTDLAVLRAQSPIPAIPVPMGDSDQLAIGELAIAIGNPGDQVGVLFGTVTAGIISALDRKDVNADNFRRKVRVIQTDAAINIGNSGGALLNAKGELIGIPTLKIMYDSDTVYEGLGFAIPINTAKPIIEQLISNGKVVRPRMGISVEAFEGPEEALKFYPPASVQVVIVEPGGPADRAGIKPLDLITHIEGIRVKTYPELAEVIDQHQSGEMVELTIYRCFNQMDNTLLPEAETLDVKVQLEMIE